MASWLQALLNVTDFFTVCELHANCTSGKRKKSFFCKQCLVSLCQECKKDHRTCDSRNALQIVISGRLTALKACEAERLIDTSGLETFTINGGPIFYLHARPRGIEVQNSVLCRHCKRVLHGALYCSLYCKLQCQGFVAHQQAQVDQGQEKNIPSPFGEVAPDGDAQPRSELNDHQARVVKVKPMDRPRAPKAKKAPSDRKRKQPEQSSIEQVCARRRMDEAVHVFSAPCNTVEHDKRQGAPALQGFRKRARKDLNLMKWN
ncbi:hypothetical protein SELMODRAFT_429869 [Selaginella moellendorffii]|uniref:B box-type domain-containing protein n=1 Tax=Selaginella moellendorffii TaxID=88036 RepID=D8T7K9_SELML|nr:hypothetical protein SELMODRAFT_429869 [Selaginella moellendorffii]